MGGKQRRWWTSGMWRWSSGRRWNIRFSGDNGTRAQVGGKLDLPDDMIFKILTDSISDKQLGMATDEMWTSLEQ
jgi:hypothetical protein